MFNRVTGYGYDDLGKDKLDELYAIYFNTEAALVRTQLVSGTHAIATAVLGNLNAGDELVTIGKPYDTLTTVFKKISQKYNINYKVIAEITPENLDLDLISQSLTDKTKVAFLQRSRGYEWRDSYSLQKLK